MGYEEIAVTSGAVKMLTAALVIAAEYALVQVIGGNVRVTLVKDTVPVTGVSPAGFGVTVFGGSNFTLSKFLMLYFAAIAEDGTDAQLQVLYGGINRTS